MKIFSMMTQYKNSDKGDLHPGEYTKKTHPENRFIWITVV